jgi:hypothetical protein
MNIISRFRHKVDTARTQADHQYFWNSMARRIAPEIITEYPGYLKINDSLVKTLVIGVPIAKAGGWPVGLSPAFQDQLLDIGRFEGCTISISSTFVQIPTHEAIELLENAEFRNSENREISKENNPDDTVSQHLDIEREGLRFNYEVIMKGKEKMFHTAYLITIWAKNQASMIRAMSHINSVLASNCILSEVPEWRMLDSLKAALPFPTTCDFSWVELLSSYAAMLPTTRNPNSRQDDTGLLFGVDTNTGKEVVVDLSRLPAQHLMFVGPTGSGKTYTLLMLLMRAHDMLKKRIIFCTPKADVTTNYRAVAEYYGDNATVIDIGPNGKNINPLQILYDKQVIKTNTWAAKSAYDYQKVLISLFFRIWFDGTMSPNMDNYLDRTLTQVWNSKGIYKENPDTWKNADWPVLNDLRAVWEQDIKNKSSEIETAKAMLHKTFILSGDGRLSYMNQPTNIDLSKDFIVVDLSNVPDDVQDAMNVFVTGVMGMRFKTDTNRESIIAIDEGGVFLRNAKLASFILKLITQGRSFDIGLWLATQQMSDLQKADLLEEFKTNIFIDIVLGANIKTDSIKILGEYFALDQSACDALLQADVGEGIIQVDGETTPTTFKPTDLEHAVIKGQINQFEKPSREIIVDKAVAEIAGDNRIYFENWIHGDAAHMLKDHNFEPVKVQLVNANGTIRAWIDRSIIQDGKVLNQSIDHYATVCQLGGVLARSGFNVEINHYDDADIVARLNGKVIAFEYERPGSHTTADLIEKKERAEKYYGSVMFIGTAENLADLKFAVGDKNVIKRGSELKDTLDQLMIELKEA